MTSAGDQPIIVVPCYNEEHRLDESGFLNLVMSGRVRLLFVDDGSTDGTLTSLARLRDAAHDIDLIELSQNCGKSEAVRRGLLEAINRDASVVGYFDADFATPAEELLRLIATMKGDGHLAAVFGARVARLGSTIERNYSRHYAGRVYATLASLALGVTVYDTQCGAKVFRTIPTFCEAIARPFRSTWAFDVELLDRLLRGNASVPGIPEDAFLEVPLNSWRDVRGSKLRFADGLAMIVDVLKIGINRRRGALADR
jgi:glycosyltransferase involved in cell wall biosynthesis